MAIPIWKDKFVSLGNADSYDFRIVADADNVIYSGKANKRPGETTINIRINDICADYLHNNLPAMIQRGFTANGSVVSFYVQKYVSNAWTTAEVVEFYNDWSYDPSHNPATMGLAAPINGKIDRRMWLLYTTQSESMVTATIHLTDGTSFNVYIPVEITADFNFDYNDDFSIEDVRDIQPGSIALDLSQWQNLDYITIGATRYDVVDFCNEWALYYVNAHGGWDALLIEGNTTQRDNLTRYTRKVEYDNRDSRNRGTENYLNEISKVFTLHTSWLHDDEAERMHHLLNSTNVYLYNINYGKLVPVVLNNTTTEYKTYKSNGGRLVNYTIEATIAQDMIRR